MNRETALGPTRLAAALAAGGRGVLPVAATTATAGIIVGVITLTGLGLKVAGLIVTLAGSSLLLTIVYAGARRLGARPRRAGDRARTSSRR